LRPSRFRVRLETAIAAVAGILGILTIFWHDWIEALTGWDPDHHNGSFEWIIIVGLLVVAVVVGAMARRDWRSSAALARE
jgi:undecaprenyl pyrophosphate phosphatase UppP